MFISIYLVCRLKDYDTFCTALSIYYLKNNRTKIFSYMKKTIRLNEQEFRGMMGNLIREALEELTFTTDQLAAMAGKAQASKKTGLSAIGNKAYNDRKERQRQIFANMAAQGNGGTTKAQGSTYDVDQYQQQFDPNAKSGEEFNINRWQWNDNGPNVSDGITTGSQHNQQMGTSEYWNNVVKPLQPTANVASNPKEFDKQYDNWDQSKRVYNAARHNQKMYNQAQQNVAQGKNPYDPKNVNKNGTYKDESPTVQSHGGPLGSGGYNDALRAYQNTNAGQKDFEKEMARKRKFKNLEAGVNEAISKALNKLLLNY